MRVISGLFLLAHGLVFLLYLVKDPDDPKWPFTFDRSWLIPERWRQPVGVALLIATVTLFVLLALAVWGVPGLTGLWPALAVIASVASLLLLTAYWQTQLVLGVIIAVALIVIATTEPGWTDNIG